MTKIKFTKATVDAIATPTAAQCGASGYLWYYDTVQPGLRLKVTPAGSKTFFKCWRDPGGQRKLKLGKYGTITVEQAREAFKVESGKIASGVDPVEERRAARLASSMADLFDAYREQHIIPADNADTIAAATRSLDHAKAELGHLSVHEVGRADIHRARDKLADRPGRQNTFITYVRAAINWGRDRGYWPEDRVNPAEDITANPSESLKREVTEDQFARIGAAMSAMMTETGIDPGRLLAIWFIALTGARPIEAIRLRPEYIDQDRQEIRLPKKKHKTGKKVAEPRVFEITEEIADILDRAAKLREVRGLNDFVFARPASVSEKGWLDQTWRSIKHRAKVKDVLLYNLRSSVATAAVEDLGLNDAQAMDITAHKDAAVWRKSYRVSRKSTLRANAAAMSRLQNSKLFGAGKPDAPDTPPANVVALKRAS